MDSRKYFIISVGLIAIVTGAWLSWRVMVPPPSLQTATLFPAPAALVEFSLLDQDGNAFSRDSFKGSWNLVFFGFTNCPDVCPTTLQVLATARTRMLTNGVETPPRIVLVSVDPERDTPAIIGAYAAHFGDGIGGVTGSLAETKKLTDGLGIYFGKSGIDGDNYTVDHSAVVIVVNPAGQFHALFGTPHAAENFAHDMPIIMTRR